MGQVGFEAWARVPFLVGFMIQYTSRYKIILAAMTGNSINNLTFGHHGFPKTPVLH
ncbi:MAG TPA: hypothetical protein VFS97_05410 [Nitrososphaeraceae archaeon]|nr:hypothetical protein [Nitrososphaeraceae archaeon]